MAQLLLLTSDYRFALREFSKYVQLTWVTSAGLGGAAAADIVIAVSLVYYLSQNRTGFQQYVHDV